MADNAATTHVGQHPATLAAWAWFAEHRDRPRELQPLLARGVTYRKSLFCSNRVAKRHDSPASAAAAMYDAIMVCIGDAEGQEAVDQRKMLELTKGQVQLLASAARVFEAHASAESESLRGGFADVGASASEGGSRR